MLHSLAFLLWSLLPSAIFWSRPEDRELLIAHLVHAPIKRLVTIPGATHFVHLDRNDHGRQQFLDEVLRFCRE
jgi:pimeloyl-ACP methyl ester carboxylesterase